MTYPDVTQRVPMPLPVADVCPQCSATAHVWSTPTEQTVTAGGFSFVISSRHCVCTLCDCSAVLSSAVAQPVAVPVAREAS